MTRQSTWRPRSLYTCTFIWISTVGGRFLVLFLEHQAQLSSSELGTILAFAQGVTVVASSFTGSYADVLEARYPHRGRAMVVAGGITLGGIVFGGHAIPIQVLVPWLPPVLWHGFLRLLVALATAMIFPVMDGMCLDYLGENTQDYGKERLYGAVSWGVTNVVIAVGLQYVGFSIMYVMTILATLLTLIVIWLFVKDQETRIYYEKRDSNVILSDDDVDDDDDIDDDQSYNNNHNENYNDMDMDMDNKRTISKMEHEHASASSTIHILYLLCISGFGVCFMVSQITQSSGQAIVDTLIFLYFEQLQSSYILMGWTVVLTVAFEIPLFHIAPILLKSWGPGILIPIASVSYVVRVFGYSYIPEGHVAYVLWLEPLHGVTYACMAMAGVELISYLTPPGYSASGQAALQILVGTGSVVGLLFGGYLQDQLGPRLMYRISGGIVAIGCILFTIALGTCPLQKNHKNDRNDSKVQSDTSPSDQDSIIIEMVHLVDEKEKAVR